MSSAPEIYSSDIDQSKFGVEQLTQMREQFSGESDETLARFLIARNNNKEKAAELLVGHLFWKKENWPILKSSCLSELSKGKMYVHGTDKEGHPLLVYRACLNNANDRDLEEMGKLVCWWMATALSVMPRDKSKITILIDRTDYESKNTDYEFVKHLSPIMQNNFPERVYRVIVYPSGFIFYGLWNMIKWFLDPVTQSKVQPMLALSGVQQYIDNEYIPSSMGGGSDFTYDPDNFSDPYTTEEILAAYPEVPVSPPAAAEA